MYISRSFYQTLIGFSICLFFSYRFLLPEKLPYDINDFISLKYLGIIFLLAFCKFIELLFLLKKFFNKNLDTPLKRFLGTLLFYFYYLPLETFSFMILKLHVIRQILKLFSCGLPFLRIDSPFFIISFLLCYQYLPLCLYAIFLCIDVFVLNKIFLFYKFFFFIIWNYSLRSILGLLYFYNTHELKSLETNFNFTVHIPHTLIPEFNFKGHNNPADDLKTSWAHFYNNLDFLQGLHLYRSISKTLLFFQFLTALLFFIAWFTFILKVLFCKYLMLTEGIFLFHRILKFLIFPW